MPGYCTHKEYILEEVSIATAAGMLAEVRPLNDFMIGMRVSTDLCVFEESRVGNR